MVSYSTEYAAMIIIGGLFLFIGFIGIVISIISIFFTPLSIYSKTFSIVSGILFVCGLSLVVSGVVVGTKEAEDQYNRDSQFIRNQFNANVQGKFPV